METNLTYQYAHIDAMYAYLCYIGRLQAAVKAAQTENLRKQRAIELAPIIQRAEAKLALLPQYSGAAKQQIEVLVLSGRKSDKRYDSSRPKDRAGTIESDILEALEECGNLTSKQLLSKLDYTQGVSRKLRWLVAQSKIARTGTPMEYVYHRRTPHQVTI